MNARIHTTTMETITNLFNDALDAFGEWIDDADTLQESFEIASGYDVNVAPLVVELINALDLVIDGFKNAMDDYVPMSNSEYRETSILLDFAEFCASDLQSYVSRLYR